MDELKLKDARLPDDDFTIVRPHEDGTIEIIVYDTANPDPYRFTSITKTDAVVLAHKLMEWANA